MTAPPEQSVAVQDILFGDNGMASALQMSGAADVVRAQLPDFTQATRNQAVREVERMSTDLLDLKPSDLIISALVNYASLRAAAQRTIAARDSEELVELLSHQVTLDNQPAIDLLVNSTHVATVHLLLSLVINIQALVATVREGRLITVQLGRCDIDVSFGIEGRTVAHKQSQLSLPVFLPLGSGIPLAGRETSSDAVADVGDTDHDGHQL
jgi:hypothetical protein